MLDSILAISIVINFVLLIYIIVLNDRVEVREHTIAKIANTDMYGAKKSWYQYTYILTKYSILLKYTKELEKAFKRYHTHVQDGDPICYSTLDVVFKDYETNLKIFSKDWSSVTFPTFGPEQINELIVNYKNQILSKSPNEN